MALLALMPEVDQRNMAAGALLESVLSTRGARSADVVAINDEGISTVVESWPPKPRRDPSDRSAWMDHDWAPHLQSLAVSGAHDHVTVAGRAVYPLMAAGLLWGVVVVDPGAACPRELAAALAPHLPWIAEAVRARITPWTCA